MAIGNLKPIKLIEYTEVIDAFGDATESVTNIYKMWAEVSDQGGTRGQEIGRTAMSDSKTFKVNFRGYLITANYKIEYFGQTYAITNVQRVQEKRFNYILSGFCTFEASAGSGGGGVVNPTSFDYNQETGIFTFLGGNLAGNLLQMIIRNTDGSVYVNNFNERVSQGPGDDNVFYYPYLTPPDVVTVSWYILAPTGGFNQLTPTASDNLTCERLCIRDFRIYEFGNQGEIISFSVIDNGVNVFNCVGDEIGFAVGIEEYVNLQNADPVNSQYFTITSYRLDNSPVYGPNYLLTVAPVDPYQQWNPANTILYLQAENNQQYQYQTYSDGVPVTPTGEFSRFYLGSPLYFQILSSHPIIIKWPNGVSLQYPSCDLYVSSYDWGVYNLPYMDIYFDPAVTRFAYLMNGGEITQMPDNLPNTISDLNIVGYLSDGFTVPASVNKLELSFNNYTEVGANVIIDSLVENNLSNGTLNILAQLNGYLNDTELTNLPTLYQRGWTIS